jgi:hypothetical protein
MLSCEQLGHPFYSFVTSHCIFISCVTEFVISIIWVTVILSFSEYNFKWKWKTHFLFWTSWVLLIKLYQKMVLQCVCVCVRVRACVIYPKSYTHTLTSWQWPAASAADYGCCDPSKWNHHILKHWALIIQWHIATSQKARDLSTS